MKVRVRASDLAALAGRHDFRTQEDAVREVWAGATGGRRKEKEVKAERVLRDVPAEVRTEVAQLLHVPDAPAAIVQALDARSLHVAKGDERVTQLVGRGRVDTRGRDESVALLQLFIRQPANSRLTLASCPS